MFRRFVRSRSVQQVIGSLLAGYLTLVRRTNRTTFIPNDAYGFLETEQPIIITMWHGQHFMQTFYKRPEHTCTVMISRHADGEFNAIAAQKLGMGVIRGSGAQRADQVQKRGGIGALRGLLSLLKAGENVSMTADVPKISRVAGAGIILLAQLSGRPIYPIGVVCSRRIDFKSWDAASVGLPFGRCAIVVGNPITVPREADAATFEAQRRAVEAELDRVYAAGYAALGQKDPGAGRTSVIAARDAEAAKLGAGALAGSPPMQA
jgi:lysophospholipid acyltransferase (LPLAT)-like uncharacterized protein